MKLANLSIWNNKYTEVYDFTPSQTGSNYNLEVFSKPYKQELFVDLYSFEKIIEKAKQQQGVEDLNNLKDLEAIFVYCRHLFHSLSMNNILS